MLTLFPETVTGKIPLIVPSLPVPEPTFSPVFTIPIGNAIAGVALPCVPAFVESCTV